MKHRIVILGAGYGGAVAAGRLARRLQRDDVDITLVNAAPDFVERIRMHQLAVGQDLPTRPLRDVLAGTGVTLRVERVVAIDTERRTVSLSGTRVGSGAVGAELSYDTLVYALGSSWDGGGVPGVAEHAHHIADRTGALRLRDRLAELVPGSRVVVAGGGLTGIEAVTEIAEARRDLDVALVARGELGGWLSAKGQRHLREAVDRLGITLHEHADVERVDAGEVAVGDVTIPADVTVWSAGFGVQPIVATTNLEVSPRGQIVVDGTMRSVSHPDVYAIGDAALAEGARGNPLRMSCASAIPMAWQAADSIAARLTGGKLPSTSLAYVHVCISLGRQDGLVQMVTVDDQVRSAAPGGRLAARHKELICRYVAWAVAHPMPYPVPRRRITRQPAPVG